MALLTISLNAAEMRASIVKNEGTRTPPGFSLS
jgi:hypothetical protein